MFMRTAASAAALSLGLALAMPALAADQGDAGEPDHEGVIEKFHSPPPGAKKPGHGDAGQAAMEPTENVGEPDGSGMFDTTKHPAPDLPDKDAETADLDRTSNNPTDDAGEPDGGGVIEPIERPAPELEGNQQ